MKIIIEAGDRPVHVSTITELPQKANMTVEGMIVNNDTTEDDSTKVTMEFRVYSFNSKGINGLFEQLWQVEGIKQVRMNWRD